MSDHVTTDSSGAFSRMAPRRVLALGVEDQLGVEAVRAIAAAGARVEVVDYLEEGADLRTRDAVVNLTPALEQPRSWLGHLVRMSGRRRRWQLAASLAEALQQVPNLRFIQRSTAALYVDGGDEWIDEDWPLEPNDATFLADAFEGIARAHSEGGGDAVVLRFGHPFDSRIPCDGEIARLARKGWLPFWGRDDAYLPLVRIDDAAAAVVAALEAPPGTFNVAAPDLYTNERLNARAARLAGHDLASLEPAIRAADRDLLDRSWRLTSAAFTRATGWQPQPVFAPSPTESSESCEAGSPRLGRASL